MILNHLTELNWLAVVVAAIATFILGGVWYTALFGKAWQRANGFSDEQLKAMGEKRPMPVFLAMQMVCYIVIAIGIALLVRSAGIITAGEGALLGLVVAVIVGAVVLTNHLPTPVAWSGYFINASYSTIYCVGTGAILGAWQ